MSAHNRVIVLADPQNAALPRALEADGAVVVAAIAGVEGLAAALAEPTEAVVCGGSVELVVQVLSRVAEVDETLPVIAVGEPEMMDPLLSQGLTDYVTPAAIGRLALSVRRASERRGADAAARQAVDELRRLNDERADVIERLMRAHEEERHGLAAEIHGDILQKVAGLGVRLGMLRRKLEDPALFDEVAVLESLITPLAARLRRLESELSPPALESHGLRAALQSYLMKLGDDAPGLEVEFVADLTEEPALEARTLLYRAAQEVLTGVRATPGARLVRVGLRQEEDAYVVSIEDSGSGVELSGAPATPGQRAARQRVESAGGRWEVEHGEGNSTRIGLRVPRTPRA